MKYELIKCFQAIEEYLIEIGREDLAKKIDEVFSEIV